MTSKRRGRNEHEDTKLLYTTIDSTPERKREAHRLTQKRYRQRLQAEKADYAGLRILQQDQLRGRQIRSNLPADTLTRLSAPPNPAPDGSVASDVQSAAPQVSFDDDELPHVDQYGSQAGDLESFASLAGADQVIIPALSRQQHHVAALNTTPVYPEAYTSDDDLPPASPPRRPLSAHSSVSSRSRSRSPSMSSHSSPAPFLSEQDEVYNHFNTYTHGTTRASAADIDPLDEYDEPIDDADLAPSSWPWSTQLPSTMPSRPRTHTQTTFATTTRTDDVNPSTSTGRRAFERAAEAQNPALMLLEHLKYFQGCSPVDHKRVLDEHNDAFAEKGILHSRLEHLTHANRFPNVLRSSDFLTHNKLHESKMTRENFCLAFEGRHNIDEREHGFTEPESVCIHASHAKNPESQSSTLSYDCDSHCGWPISLQAFKQGVTAFFVPPKTQQMTTNLHLSPPSEEPGTFSDDLYSFLELDKTTHMYFGKAKGFGAQIYIYFPNIHNPSTLLTNDQFTKWTDYVLSPALAQSGPSDALASYPSSFQSALARAQAAQKETHVREHHSQNLTMLEYTIDAATCHTLWDNIKTIIETPREDSIDLREFEGALIFFSAKNHKYEFRNSDISACLEEFNTRLDRSYDFDFVDCMIIDTGKEVTSADSKPRIAFFRDCCIERAVRGLFASQRGPCTSPSRYVTHYNHCGLRDAKNFTAIPPKDSLIQKDLGVISVQWYSQSKQRWDVAKLYPGAGDNINPVVLGKQRFDMHNSVGKTYASYPALRTAMGSAKTRIHAEVVSKGSYVHHSAREEYRMTLSAFHALRRAAREDAARNVHMDQTADTSRRHTTPLWLVPTHEWLPFVWHVINCRLSYLEYVLLMTNDQPSANQSKVLLLFVDMFRVFMQAVNLPSRRNLWTHVTRSRDTDALKIGAGFSRTMVRYGFCWLTEIIDWSSHCFIREYRDQLLLSDQALFARYKVHKWQVVEIDAMLQAVDALGDVLRAWKHAKLHALALQALVDLVLRQFRSDVREVIRADVQPKWRERLNEENCPFEYRTMLHLYAKPPYLVGEVRQTITTRNPDALMERYFGDLDQTIPNPSRENFHRRPYRKLAWAVTCMLRRSSFIAPPYNHLGSTAFQTSLRLACLRNHSILPSTRPGCKNFLELTHRNKDGSGGQRQWVAVSRALYAKDGSVPGTADDPWFYSLGGKPTDQEPPPNPWKRLTAKQMVDYIIHWAEEEYGRRSGLGRGL